MISLRSLLPPQAPRAAFGMLVANEFRLARRTPTVLIVGLVIPLLLLVIFASLPVFRTPDPALGGLTPFDIYVPVLLAFVIAALGLLGLPVPLATYREQGILRRLSTTPVPPAWLLGAQLVVNFCLAALAMLILMAVGMLAFGLAAPMNPAGFVLALLLSIAAIFAIGLVIAAVAPRATVANGIAGATFAPLMFFAGLWLPRAYMPIVLRDVSNLTPLGAAVVAIQSALQTGFPPVSSLLVLVAYAVVFGWLAVRFFRWE